jgi:hypothetical protein
VLLSLLLLLFVYIVLLVDLTGAMPNISSTSCNLVEFVYLSTTGAIVYCCGWKELKKSSPSKFMSSFLAFKVLISAYSYTLPSEKSPPEEDIPPLVPLFIDIS